MDWLKSRLRALEKFKKSIVTAIPIAGNKDCFISALVGDQNAEKYKTESGDYDVIQALNDTAKEDWKS